MEQKELPMEFVYYAVTQHAMQKGKVFSIVRMGVEDRIFSGDACLCFDGVENLPLARGYWRRDRRDRPTVPEALADGRMGVLEIVETY